MPREARRANKINREKNKQSSNARSAMAWFLFCAHNTYYQVHSHFRYFMQIITSLWCAYASTWIHTSVIISAECTAHCTTTTQRMETFFLFILIYSRIFHLIVMYFFRFWLLLSLPIVCSSFSCHSFFCYFLVTSFSRSPFDFHHFPSFQQQLTWFCVMFFFSSLNSTQFRIENGERGKRAEDKERSGKRFREIQRERERGTGMRRRKVKKRLNRGRRGSEY